MNTSKHLVSLIAMLLLGAAWTTAHAQTTQTMRFDADKAVFMQEITTAAGIEGDGDDVHVLFSMAGDVDVDLQEDDVVLMANGKRIHTVDDLRAVYESVAPGDEVKLGIRRDERRFLVSFERADPDSAASAQGGHPTMIRMAIPAGDGASPEVILELGALVSETGGVVSVAGMVQLPGTDALDVAEGDRIVALDDTPVSGLESLMQQRESSPAGSKLTFTLERDGEQHQVSVTKSSETVLRKSR